MWDVLKKAKCLCKITYWYKSPVLKCNKCVTDSLFFMNLIQLNSTKIDKKAYILNLLSFLPLKDTSILCSR
jgi:hypothetical protein